MAVRPRVLIAAVLLSLLWPVAISVAAADLQWLPYGVLPPDAPAFSISLDPGSPNSVYAATLGAGLQRTDDGRSWKEIGGGVLPRRLWRIAIDPSKGPSGSAPMYVGSGGEGFFKSLDGGKTWEGANHGLDNPLARNVRAIGMGRGILVIGTSDGVFKSFDGGKSWQSMGLRGTDVSSVAFAQYSSPTVIMAGIDGTRNPGSRALLTRDGGGSWIQIKQGLPGDMVVAAMAAGPPVTVPSGGTIRPLFIAGSGGVYKSDDLGQSWAQMAGLPAQGFGGLALSPADPNIVYASSDGGAGASGGVWRSTDRGGTWTALAGGLNEHGITALAVGRNSPATLAAAAWNPDRPVVVVYTLSDTQASPSGAPEDGVCPEPSCIGGTIQVSGATPQPGVAAPSPTPCLTSAAPTPTLPALSPSASLGAPNASPSASAAALSLASAPPSVPPSPSPSCLNTQPRGPSGSRNDLPLVLGGIVLAGLVLLVIVRLVWSRRGGE